MNKNAIQRFAIWARTELISQVSQRAYQYDITADGYGDYDAEAVGGRLLSDDEKKQRQQLISQIRSKGYTQVMEEIAYTWFNRFIALRFMEVNNYLPTHIRVFSDASGAFKPEILSDALHLDLDGLNMEKVSELIEKNQSEDLYRYLLLTQCNALSASLPRMFENMGSYTELLLPNNILRQDSVLGRMVTDIPEEDWTDQVQIIGWLYQYYNTELKAEVFSKTGRLDKNDVPAATQLFTPDWIVRYMVENSLGRLWIEGHPDDNLKAEWKYYLDEAEQETDVQAQLEAIRAEYRTIRPQDIKIIDPCMGSGHILVYAFDVLVQIYKRAGFSERDAAQSILENNLYGLDIDERAAQLAYFAVMMKARQYDRRIFTRKIQPHVYSIAESNTVHIPAKWRLGAEQTIAEKLVHELKDAKEYGSILNLTLLPDELAALRSRLMEIEKMSSEGNLMDMMECGAIIEGLHPLVEIAEVMVQKYDIAVTNPPYMAVSSSSAKVNSYVNSNYIGGKTDLFAVFIEKCLQMCKINCFVSMITMQSWMFLTSFEKLRDKMLGYEISDMVHLGARGFDEISGEVVQTTSFVIRKSNFGGKYIGHYSRLVSGLSENEKEQLYRSRRCLFENCGRNFFNIPQEIIAYWVSDATIRCFSEERLEKVFITREGMATADNDRFLRYWFELTLQSITFDCRSAEDALNRAVKWVPYNKGGGTRDWYGNNEYVVNWENDGAEIRNNHDPKTGRIRSHNYNGDYGFREGLTWSAISSGNLSVRYSQEGFLFDSKGAKGFRNGKINLYWILGLLNSKVAMQFLQFLSPTLDFKVGDVISIPFIQGGMDTQGIEKLSESCVQMSKEEWDSFETSWDFEMHPIVKKALSRFHWNSDKDITIEYVYKYVARDFEDRFYKLKANEEELNRIFIEIYGLQDELTPEIEDKEVTVRRADLGRDIRSMISYAVGCMFGRYSLAQWGLAYAGGEWNPGGRGFANYGEFEPDKDNIIPICDDEYFDDDITGRFIKWVEVVFGKETLEENLKYIADALGGKGTAREVIRNYFLNDFYADHLKTYQKRPIYWLFDSGKKNGFKALIYMHRYQSDLLARMRTDYVHEQQERYRTQLKHIGDAMDSASATERVKLAQQQKKLQEQALELQKYEEKVHHLADQNIKIDLDDGVVHNYELFADVLAKRK